MGRTARNTDRAGTLTGGPGPFIVGILNVTPDSFSDGGDFLDPEAAAEHAATMLDEGADVLDVGGESTRPGWDPVSQEEEIRRVVPVLERILSVRPEAVISVDTYRAGTATAALEAGASLVNDVTALRGDPRMVYVIEEAACPVILMHMQGEPKTMQKEPQYQDVVREVSDFLAERAEYAVAAGVRPENIIVDPGIGFGKNLEHNLALLRNLEAIVDLGFPVLIGASRKSFIERITSTSKVYETVPVEVEEEQPDYLNCVVELECGIPAIELLRYCQGVEAAL